MRRLRPALPALLTLCVSTAAALGLAEAGARVFGPPPEPREGLVQRQRVVQEAWPRRAFFRFEPSPDGGRWQEIAPGSKRESFPARRPAGEALVFIAGESVAQLLDGADLQKALASAWRRPVRVVNAGVGGYGASAVEAVARQLAPFHPDAVVVLVGNNPVSRLFPRWLFTLRRFSSLVSLGMAAARVTADTPEGFERRLRAIAAAAPGARIVFCTLPLNRQTPPPAELPLRNAAFRAAWLAWLRADPESAARLWTVYAEDHPKTATGRYWLGRALMATGKPAEGRAQLDEALELARPAATPSRNAAVRRVAAETGSALADVAGAFDAAGAGADAFSDQMHWEQAWKPLAIRTIAAAVSGRPEAAAGPRPPAHPALPPERVGEYMGLVIGAGGQMVGERFVSFFERLWLQLPQETARAFSSKEAAEAALEASSSKIYAPMRAREWRAVRRVAAEALWRLGRARESQRLLAELLREGPRDLRTRHQQLVERAWDGAIDEGADRLLGLTGAEGEPPGREQAAKELEDYRVSGRLARLSARGRGPGALAYGP